MIGTANNHLPFPGSATAVSAQAVPVRRRIGREAGLALEKLAHAIEYLTDEFINDASPQFRGSRVEAIELLMSLNRRVYFDCPQVPTLGGRISAFLRRVL